MTDSDWKKIILNKYVHQVYQSGVNIYTNYIIYCSILENLPPNFQLLGPPNYENWDNDQPPNLLRPPKLRFLNKKSDILSEISTTSSDFSTQQNYFKVLLFHKV